MLIDFCKKICSSHNKIFLTLDQNEKSDQGHWTCATLIWETIMSTIMDNELQYKITIKNVWTMIEDMLKMLIFFSLL